MRRNRFDQIMRSLHFQDNRKLDYNHKFSKVRPLITFMLNRFMQNNLPSQSISHDKAMIEYFGKHSCKQSICNKPIRFGYKIWYPNFPSSYQIAFEPYEGKFSAFEVIDETNKFRKCAATVLQLFNQ